VSESFSGERLTALLWRAARASTRLYQTRLSDFELTTRQAAALLSLVENPGVTLGALADTLRSDQPTASAVVDRLLAAELVKRETDPEDRRRARLYPTEKALRIAEEIEEARRETEAFMEQILGPNMSRKLQKGLLVLSERMEAEAQARGAPVRLPGGPRRRQLAEGGPIGPIRQRRGNGRL
jgi:DNA-binding MarR family transcriptional regulator